MSMRHWLAMKRSVSGKRPGNPSPAASAQRVILASICFSSDRDAVLRFASSTSTRLSSSVVSCSTDAVGGKSPPTPISGLSESWSRSTGWNPASTSRK